MAAAVRRLQAGIGVRNRQREQPSSRPRGPRRSLLPVELTTGLAFTADPTVSGRLGGHAGRTPSTASQRLSLVVVRHRVASSPSRLVKRHRGASDRDRRRRAVVLELDRGCRSQRSSVATSPSPSVTVTTALTVVPRFTGSSYEPLPGVVLQAIHIAQRSLRRSGVDRDRKHRVVRPTLGRSIPRK